jgi:hypothetical protein
MIETSQERGNRLLAEHQHARTTRTEAGAPHDALCRCRDCKPPHSPADVPILNRLGRAIKRGWKAYMAAVRTPLSDEDRNEFGM